MLLAWATVTIILLFLNLNLLIVDGSERYLGIQAAGHFGLGFWALAAEGTRGLIIFLRERPLVATAGFFLAPLLIAHFHSRARSSFLLLGVMLLGYSSIPFSRAIDNAVAENLPGLGWYIVGGLLALLFCWGILLLANWRRPERKKAGVRAGGLAVAWYLGISGWMLTVAPWGFPVIHSSVLDSWGPVRWNPPLAGADRYLPFGVMVVATFFLMVFLLEALSRSRPNRRILATTLLLPLLAGVGGASQDISLLLDTSGGVGPARPTKTQESVSGVGSFVLGTKWDARQIRFALDMADQVSDLLASGAVDEPVAYGLETAWPPTRRLRMDPFVDALGYLVRLREASPAYNTSFFGLVLGSQHRRHPLTDQEVDAWSSSVATLPSLLAEEIYLVENLIGSGRREQALGVLDHIQGILDQLPPDIAGFAMEQGDSWGTPTRQEETKLRALAFAAQALPEPDQQARSLLVRLLGPEGEPLVGVPVGLVQAFALTVDRREDGTLGTKPSPFPVYPDGLFTLTDGRGEARFSGLRGVGYGASVLAGWPGGGLPSGFLAFPQEPLPDPLPPGETVWEWRALQQGRLLLGDGGPSLAPVPDPSLALETSCPLRHRGADCWEALGASGGAFVLRKMEGSLMSQVMILGVGDSGFPVAVWVPEEFTTALASTR